MSHCAGLLHDCRQCWAFHQKLADAENPLPVSRPASNSTHMCSSASSSQLYQLFAYQKVIRVHRTKYLQCYRQSCMRPVPNRSPHIEFRPPNPAPHMKQTGVNMQLTHSEFQSARSRVQKNAASYIVFKGGKECNVGKWCSGENGQLLNPPVQFPGQPVPDIVIFPALVISVPCSSDSGARGLEIPVLLGGWSSLLVSTGKSPETSMSTVSLLHRT